MNEMRRQRWGAASGFAVILIGAAATVFERGPVSADDPAASVAAYFADNADALRAQSLLFVLGTGALLWFLGSLRGFLSEAEGGSARLSAVAFGAGVAWVALSLVAQAFQIGVAGTPGGEVPPALITTMDASFIVAGLPLAVMLVACAVVSLRTKVFPAWLAWLSMAAAAAQVASLLGIVVQSGPLALDGWFTLYAPYPLLVVWLAVTSAVMVVRIGRPAATNAVGETRQEVARARAAAG